MEVSRTALPEFVAAFVERLPTVPQKEAYLVGLKGELGAGKTTFVQEIARILGVPEQVTSPTFVLVRTYPIARPPFFRLIHVDAYRLHADDTDTFGFGAYRADPQNLIFAEWPEHLPGKPVVDTSLEFRHSSRGLSPQGVQSEDMREIIEI